MTQAWTSYIAKYGIVLSYKQANIVTGVSPSSYIFNNYQQENLTK